jgi:predicted amidohydrolase
MYDVLLKGGEIIDPSQGLHAKGSPAIRDGKVALIQEGDADLEAAEVFDMRGKIVAPGLIDIHIFSHYLTWEPGGMILLDGTVYSELEAAHNRGVVLDACHGLNHFSLTVSRHAIEKGLLPTVISTDMVNIVWPSAQSLPVVMSKFLNWGLTLDQVIEMTTINPANAPWTRRTTGEASSPGDGRT